MIWRRVCKLLAARIVRRAASGADLRRGSRAACSGSRKQRPVTDCGCAHQSAMVTEPTTRPQRAPAHGNHVDKMIGCAYSFPSCSTRRELPRARNFAGPQQDAVVPCVQYDGRLVEY